MSTTRHGVVLGCPRSGTTFLLSVLNSLPSLECMNGTLLPVTIPHVVNQSIDKEIYDALAVGFERALDDYLHSGRYDARLPALRKWTQAPTGVSGFVRALQLPRRKPEMIVYKEPFLAFAPQFTLDALPDARIIHIYRDGRDCANSLRRKYDVLTDEKLTNLLGAEMRLGRPYDHRYVPWWVAPNEEDAFMSSSPYVRAVWMWKVMARSCYDVFYQPEVVESGRVLHLRYEDFVQDPHHHGQRLLDHLGVEGSSSFWKQIDRSRTSSIGTHKHRENHDEESRAIEAIAGDELRLYGYESHQSPSPSSHIPA